MVVTRPGSLSSITAAGRSQPGKPPSLRAFLIRNSNVLLLGLAVCALLSLGSWPLHGTSPPSSGGSLGRRGQGEGLSAEAAAAAATVTAGAGVHGYVHKDGVADLRNWHPDYKTFRQQRLQDWLAERDASLAEGRLPPPLPVFTGCQVYVNHLYRVVYLRHAKTASSSLFCHFGGCRSNSSDPAEQALRFELLQGHDAAQLAALWRDYFVVTFVRSPYQRAVSSYRMMARQLAPGGAAAAAYTWDRFCADPTSFADECMRDELCQKKGRNFVYIHIQPQHDCIISEGGGWAVDFIGRVESIDADLQAVLDELQRRRPADAPPVKPLQGSLANVNGRGCNESAADGHNVAPEQYCDPAQYFEGRHAACLGQVRHHYYSDAHSLRFGPGELADE